MESNVNIDNLSLRQIDKVVAKEMIIKHHYSHKSSATRYAFGIFHKDQEHSFFSDVDELIGCMTYGYPVGREAAQSISEDIDVKEVLELTRLFIKDGYGRNIESASLSLSFKWLRQNATDIKVLISYADPSAGHLGVIYQATNWLYQGDHQRLVDSFALKYKLDDPLWIHSRTVFSKYGTNSTKILRDKIGKTFWLKREPRKHRYIYFLCGKKERKKIMKTLKHQIIPYPKNNAYDKDEIIEVTV